MQVTAEQELMSTMVLITRGEIRHRLRSGIIVDVELEKFNSLSPLGGQESDQKVPFRGAAAGNQQKKPGMCFTSFIGRDGYRESSTGAFIRLQC